MGVFACWNPVTAFAKLNMIKLNSKGIFAVAIMAAFISLSPLSAEVSDADLKELLARIEALENRVKQLETIVADGGSLGTIASTGQLPQDDGFLEKFRLRLYQQELLARGGWTQMSTWEKLQKGMKEDEVAALLGNATRELDSFKTRTDRVWQYRGDLRGDGSEARGEVRFYKGKVTDWTVPSYDY